MRVLWMSVGVAIAAATGAAQQDRPALVYTQPASNTQSTMREWNGSAWSGESLTTAMSADVAWQEVVNSPETDGRALITMGEDRSLALSMWAGGFWGTPIALASDSGVTNGKVFAAAYEQASGDLMAVYRKGTATPVYFRTYTGALAVELSYSPGLTAAPQWMELASQPRGDELVLVIKSGSELRACVWNGSAWGNPVLLESSLSGTGRPFGVAYTSQSRQAVVVWSATTGAPKYRVWDGAAWGAQANVPAVSGGSRLGWVSLAASPLLGSNEVLATLIGVNNHINLNNWTGSAWGANLIAETSAAAGSERRADIGWQADGLRAVAVWHRSGQNALRYRTWTGAWSAEAVGPDMGSESQCVRLVPGYEPHQAVMAVRRRGAMSYSDYLAYSAAGTVNLVGTINGPIASGGAGALPTSPPATLGVTDVNVGNSETRNITPGSYHDLTVGNSATLNFNGAGDYVFRLFKAYQNGTTFNFNTGGGTIRVFFTNGNFDGMNSMTMNNASGVVEVHVQNGNFIGQNTFSASNVSIFVYNGNIEFGNSLNFSGVLYASGNVGGSGTVSLPTNGTWQAGPGHVSTVVWTGGVPGSPANHAEVGAGLTYGTVALAGRPVPSGIYITRWREMGPDE
jgi:hypothetical protein